MKQETNNDTNGVEAEEAIPASRSFSAGQVVFECRPFVAVLDRKWKFSVSLSVELVMPTGSISQLSRPFETARL